MPAKARAIHAPTHSPAWPPAERSRTGNEDPGEHRLHDVEIRQASGVVLPPVPDREWRVAAELVTECAVDELSRCVPRRRLEKDDEERGDGRKQEADDERPPRREPASIWIARPQRQHEERGELRPGRECRKGTAQRR